MRLSKTPTDYLIVRTQKPKGGLHSAFAIVPLFQDTLRTLRDFSDDIHPVSLHRSFALFLPRSHRHDAVRSFLDMQIPCAWIELSTQEYVYFKEQAVHHLHCTMAVSYAWVRWLEIGDMRQVLFKTTDVDRLELLQEIFATTP